MKSDQITKEIAGGIHGTLSAIYGAAYKEHTRRHFPAIVNAVRFLRTKIQTTGRERLVFKPIKGNWSGLYFPGSETIFVDPRRTIQSVVNTFAHELVHAEQYLQGRLKRNPLNPRFHIWHGEQYSFDPMKIDHQSYLKLPWEVEANERAAELAPQALRGLL